MTRHSLAGHAFAATPQGVAQEIAHALLCACGNPLSERQLRTVMKALSVASGGHKEHLGEAIDVLTGHGLPEQPRALAVISARRPK